jgi:hypothetical protein
MLVKGISLPSFPIGCLALTASCDYVLSLVDIDFLVRVIHFGYFHFLVLMSSFVRFGLQW